MIQVFAWNQIADTAILKESSTSAWAVRTLAAATGPFANGATLLATSAGVGEYPASRNDWAMLPALDLSPYAGCSITASFQLWRESEGISILRDGGNLQVTTAASPGPASAWNTVGSASDAGLAYDTASLTGGCAAGCFLAGQPIWVGYPGKTKMVSADLSAYAGAPSVTLRFTFHSDGAIAYRGLFVGDVTVRAD